MGFWEAIIFRLTVIIPSHASVCATSLPRIQIKFFCCITAFMKKRVAAVREGEEKTSSCMS